MVSLVASSDVEVVVRCQNCPLLNFLLLLRFRRNFSSIFEFVVA